MQGKENSGASSSSLPTFILALTVTSFIAPDAGSLGDGAGDGMGRASLGCPLAEEEAEAEAEEGEGVVPL